MNSIEIKKLFSRFFPVPKFLTMPAAGVDISDNSVRFLEFADKPGKVLNKFGEYPIPDGIISKGNIKDVKALSGILGKLKKDHKIDFVRASLPEEKVYLFETQIPNDALDKDIKSILEFKLEEHVPISPQNAVFDYDIISKHKDHVDVVVAVYPRKTIEQYTDAFADAGLTLLSFETEAQAIARSVIKDGDDGTYMIVDFGNTKTGLSIVSNGILSFTSAIDIDGGTMDEAIKQYFSETEKDVNRVKREYGLVKTRDNRELFNVLMGIAESLKYNIDKHYKYWKAKVDEKGKRIQPVDKIILCGGNSNLAGLPEYLSSSLKLKVERANVWTNTTSFGGAIPELSKSNSLSYAASVGLALRSIS
jgi:type IV pilus assembly protein PilM